MLATPPRKLLYSYGNRSYAPPSSRRDTVGFPENLVDILYLSPADWPGPVGRFQHIAERFARKHRVMYADGLGVRPIGRRDWRRSASKVLRWLLPDARRPDPTRSLYRITPLAIPGQHNTAQRVNRWLLRDYIARHLKSQDFDRPLVWIAYPHPDLVAIIDGFEPGAVIYDCVDEWSGFDRAYENLAEAEKTLARRADLVFATAPPLRARLATLSPRVFLVPNGVDLDAFAPGDRAIPDDVARIPGPRIGFVGGIDERMDMDLVTAIARSRRDWQLVLAGGHLTETPLPHEPNIHWLGYRPYDRIADYMASFDVCIIPFQEDELTRALDPLKLYEYLAAGRPVVSTPLPRATDFGDVVRIARGADAFTAAVAAALRDGVSPERCIDAVRPHSWDARVATIAKQTKEHLAIDL